jgi:hypothetical protein
VLAAAVHQPVLEAELGAARECVAPALEQVVPVVGVRARAERVAQVLAQLAAGEAQPALVDEGHVALGVGHPHQRRGGIGELAEARLGVAHLLLVAGALDRRAEHVRERLEEVAVLRAELLPGAAVHRDPTHLAAGGADLGGQRAHHAQLALDRRRVEARLLAEVLDEHRARMVERVARELVPASVDHAADDALGQAVPGPHEQPQPIAGQLQDRGELRAQLAAGAGGRLGAQVVQGSPR